VTRTLTVETGAAAARLDVYLAAALGVSRSQAGRLLRDAAVRVNGQTERPSYAVQVGDEVTVVAAPAPATAPAAPDLPVLYEDSDLLVVSKPAGLAIHPGSGTSRRTTVADFARPRTTDPDPDRPGIVHRLDRDTSGLLILAKTAAAKAFMQQQFREHAVHKTYLLLAVGRMKPPEAVIRLPLARDPANPLRRAVVADGRESVTRYRTLDDYPGFSLVEARPETGRTHQIRVHFAAIGHPVAGDILYGPPHRPLGLKRQFLHAAALEFTAPSGQAVKLNCPLPPELAKVVQTLEGRV
jgi:23S rRNA pseudouridine1911/1915/1917 synthase